MVCKLDGWDSLGWLGVWEAKRHFIGLAGLLACMLGFWVAGCVLDCLTSQLAGRLSAYGSALLIALLPVLLLSLGLPDADADAGSPWRGLGRQ